jgi:hypothetical protein
VEGSGTKCIVNDVLASRGKDVRQREGAECALTEVPLGPLRGVWKAVEPYRDLGMEA